METLNFDIFALINAPAAPSQFMIIGAQFAAKWLLYLTGLWMVIMWIRSGRAMRTALLDSAFSAALGLGLSQVISYFYYHPRPFEIKLGNQFLGHATESSFPSDHGVIMFSIALALLMSRVSRVWGIVLMLVGLVVAWSRVYLGVHFPFDMAGAFVVALFAVLIITGLPGVLDKFVYGPLLKIYNKILNTARIPHTISPRS